MSIDRTPDRRRRVQTAIRLLKLRLIEHVTYDSRVGKACIGIAGCAAALLFGALGRSAKFLQLLCRLHRSDFFGPANAIAIRQLRKAASGQPPLSDVLLDHVRYVPKYPGTANFYDHPEFLTRLPTIVLKSPENGSKGVVLTHYNHVFPLFARMLDLERVTERYHLVLEPSWRGFAELDILCYARYRFPVFVQASEPRDAAVLRDVCANFVPMPLSANSWVDHRVFRPVPTEKEYDVAMVAVLSPYKRHAQFFAALGKLRRNGHRLRVLLLGGARQYTREQILEQAEYFNVADQVTLLRDMPYEEVNGHINKAKVHVLWSRSEGVNRAIIECMFAGLPSILREGFNYGYRYPYINDQTGAFATEAQLPRTLLDLVERAPEMDPRGWAMKHMACQRSTEILSDSIGAWCRAHGEPWTGDVAVKVTRLHGHVYWDERDKSRFDADYAYLRDCLTVKDQAA